MVEDGNIPTLSRCTATVSLPCRHTDAFSPIVIQFFV